MTIVLSGEVFDPFRIHETAEPLDREDLGITNDIWIKVIKWQEEYSVFASMNLNELTFHSENIKLLDKRGINLIKEIANSTFLKVLK
ncbi:MAG: hypothetical protein M3Q58_15575 [Bacteroidota bacterium]|nr:hypothetical protein [Bacteroidota bacterium]